MLSYPSARIAREPRSPIMTTLSLRRERQKSKQKLLRETYRAGFEGVSFCSVQMHIPHPHPSVHREHRKLQFTVVSYVSHSFNLKI